MKNLAASVAQIASEALFQSPSFASAALDRFGIAPSPSH
jgi:hypothetical protein